MEGEALLLVSPAEAAARLGLSRGTVYALLARGELPSIHIGAARRIRVADLHAFVDRLVAEQNG
jgi:excisionase family DNA binding protein